MTTAPSPNAAAGSIQNPPLNLHRPSITEGKKWPDAILLLSLALLPLLFFWRLVTPNPADRMAIASGDFTEQYFPLRAFTAGEWVQGRIPLWNPYLFGGQPALADIQSGALYPLHVLESLMLGWSGLGFPLWALELQVIAHFSLAAVGTYLFTRHLARRSGASLRRARFGGVIASLVFTYGGYLTGFPVQQMTILAASAWLPWVIWAVGAAATRPPTSDQRPPITGHQSSASNSQFTIHNSQFLIPRSPAPFWGALAFAMAILAGHPQTVLYIFYLSLAYTSFLAFLARPTKPAGPQTGESKNDETTTDHAPRITCYVLRITDYGLPIIRLFVPWLTIILLGLALAAAQLLPTLEFIGRSLRADLSYQAVSAGLPLNELIAILYPGFFGGSPEYVGLVSLVLIALALSMALTSKLPLTTYHLPLTNYQLPITKEIYFWTGAALVSLLLAFGGNTFLYPLFYLLAPGFEAVRQQERAFLVYSFSAAVLAGYGAVILTGPLPRPARRTYALFERRLRQAAGVALALTGFFIYGSAASTARGDEVNLFYGVLWHHLFGLLILGGVLALLALRSRRWLHRPWGMGLLALWLAFNLFTVNWRFNLEKPANPPPFTATQVTHFLQTSLPTSPPSNLPARIVSGGLLPGGHSAASVYHLPDLTGNTPLQLASVDAFMRGMPSWRAWQLLNVRYVLDTRNIADAGLKQVFEEGDLKVFEIGDPFPRAWFVSQVEVIPDDGRAMARLAAGEFDLRRAAVVAEPLKVSLAEAPASAVTVVESEPAYLKAEVNASGRQLLVFSQIFYPGWQAKIDGQAAELLRVNVIEQGVIIPAGEHTVELVFSPRSFWLGVAISGVALLVCIILLSGKRR